MMKNPQKLKLAVWKYALAMAWVFLILMVCNEKNDSARKTPLTERFDPDSQAYAFTIPNLPPVPGIVGNTAADCGTCHKTIYREWQQSTHASSLRDIQFQSELTKEDSPQWICLNCHIPVQNQRRFIVTHLLENDIFQPVQTPNPQFDKAMQQEGISCATCHIRADETAGESYIIGPNGSQNSPHPVKQNREFLHQICERCHNPQGEGLTPNLICWFYTTSELAEARLDLQKVSGEAKNCVSCHMPETQRLIAEDFTALPSQAVNQHHWVGSGIPKWFEGYDQLLARGYQSGLEVKVGQARIHPATGNVAVEIQLTNARSGHYLPTGDPERFILAIAALEDAAGKILSKQTLRIGQEWLWNPARKVGDNRLKHGETRAWEVTLPAPKKAPGLKLVITVLHVRLNSETAKYITAAAGVNEDFLENGQHLVNQAIDYYPFASFIYKEEIVLKSGKRYVYSPQELIEFSKAEKGKSLSQRQY
jgi:hypothetical protein